MTSTTASTSGPQFVPNFEFHHSVLLDVPREEAFTILGTVKGHDRTCKLSKLCTFVHLGEKDTVAIPPGKQLCEISVTGQPSASGEGTVLAIRQFFTMEETVPLLFGLIQNKVKFSGTLSWLDPTSAPANAPLYCLYENVAEGTDIKIWKTRRFEEVVDDGHAKTRVTEDVHGWAPAHLRYIVDKIGRKGHVEHMESYHTLFG